MKSRLLLLVILLLFFMPMISTAGNISLKRSVFGNWKFTDGDTSYIPIGTNGEILQKAMGNDTLAIREVGKFNDLMRVSTVVFMASAGLAVYPIYKVAKGQWKETYWKGVAGSGAALLTAILIERSARSHLMKGVKGYNLRSEGVETTPTAYLFPVIMNDRTMGLNLTIQF
jgi:hypothetical protein